MQINITYELPSKRLADLMTTAIESGDPVTTARKGGWCAGIYWQNVETDPPDNTTEPGFPWYADPKLYERADFTIEVHEVEDETIWDGSLKGIKVHRIDLEAIGRGLALMAQKAPKHFNDIMTAHGD